MEEITKSIAGRMTIAVLMVHIVVLPLLYFLLVYFVKQSNQEQFVNYVRGYTRFVADSLEHVSTASEVADILDGFMLSGTGVYADVQLDSGVQQGSVKPTIEPKNYLEDFSIGAHGDEVYFTSVPVELINVPATLRLGFDEAPILQQNRLIYVQSAVILVLYLIVVLVLVALIGRRITQPIRALQVASRKVASGDFQGKLAIDSDLIEFSALSNDLELMRGKLIGANRQLQTEIGERIKAEEQRTALEMHLRHKQRLETVGTLAGGIAHELNNILVPIVLYSEMAIEDVPTSSSARDDLLRVVKSANRAKAIVSQVLMFSRQIGETKRSPVDLVAVVNESIDLLKPAIPPDVWLTKEFESKEAMVLGEQISLGQTVVNLLTNAYQSMPSPGGSIHILIDSVDSSEPIVTFQNELPAGAYHRLVVADSGTGIGATNVERIFEPFYSTREIGEGTGLGLSVVHGIISSLDGGITVESELGQGSSFTIYLPKFDVEKNGVRAQYSEKER